MLRVISHKSAAAAKAYYAEGLKREDYCSEITARAALNYAAEKVFAKDSVVESNRLLAEAMRFSLGSLTPGELRLAFQRGQWIERAVNGERLCTSVAVLAEEVSLINFVRTGRNLYLPLKPRPDRFVDARLSKEQRAAVNPWRPSFFLNALPFLRVSLRNSSASRKPGATGKSTLGRSRPSPSTGAF